MKTSLETVSTLERKLNIQVPAAEVQEAFNRAYNGIQRQATIKGFRKGKAPISTIKTIYSERVKQDVIQDIIQSHYASALREHSLDPVGYPAIEFDPVEDNSDFAFTAEFEIRPEIKLQQIEGLQVKKEKFSVTDKYVDDVLADLQKSRAETVPVLEDRPAQKGDIAVIDFKGFIDGAEMENGSAQDHALELGSNSFIPGFEDGVVGMSVGGKATIKVQFPETYHEKSLAGKPVEFQVTLHKLQKKSLPELNDEFAAKFGQEAGGLAALKTAIREDYEKRETKRISDELRNRLLRALVAKNPVHVPKSLLQEQKKTLIEDFQKRMQQQGMDEKQFEEYKDKWDADFVQTASFMIQSSFLIDKIAADKNLKATASDIDKKMQEYAAQTGIELKRIIEFYSEKDMRSRLAYQVAEEKVVDLLLSTAKVQEVSREEIEKEEPRPTN